MDPIKIAIVGVGNCASSLLQGFEYYRDQRPEEAVGFIVPGRRCGASAPSQA
ncbi:MAG: hypothetical protein HRU01_17895 [Myxococcales bacterium]|nr:hypothetical protein [Myxococcales bacterium]